MLLILVSCLKYFVFAIALFLLLTACGGGGSGTSEPSITPTLEPTLIPTAEPKPTPLPKQLPNDIIISGYITYERVPHTNRGGLDFSLASAEPARGVTVILMDADDNEIRQSRTDSNGFYEVGAPLDALVRVVARAQIESVELPSWQFDVLDNTEDDIPYLLAGALADSSEQTRDLHAPSGWDEEEEDYADVSVRPAAPFAILDSTYAVVQALATVDATFQLPAANIYWSYRNQATPGDDAEGYIGSSKYDRNTRKMYILGSAYDDADEYDFSVIQHELGHFLEDMLSRSDNIGGSHSLSWQQDMRVAYSEGFANAFASIVSETPLYLDSAGLNAYYHFRINMEMNAVNNTGWYSENSVGKLIYDIADTDNESGDLLDLGLAGIYDVLVADSYRENDALSSIFLFSEVFSEVHGSSNALLLQAMLADEGIYGIDRHGSEESNDGGNADVLPIYRQLTQGGSIDVCSQKVEPEYNGLGVSRFILLDIVSSGYVAFHIERNTALEDPPSAHTANPDARLFNQAGLVAVLDNEDDDSEHENLSLPQGRYILEVFDQTNADNEELTGGDACFTVTVN